jgi:hypothetical protein
MDKSSSKGQSHLFVTLLGQNGCHLNRAPQLIGYQQIRLITSLDAGVRSQLHEYYMEFCSGTINGIHLADTSAATTPVHLEAHAKRRLLYRFHYVNCSGSGSLPILTTNSYPAQIHS